uniref:Uncharacterized protein n=1 Tax=Rhizophora mucronata TaxID=61149 RepID=A0A2P2KLB2_RHIMU
MQYSISAQLSLLIQHQFNTYVHVKENSLASSWLVFRWYGSVVFV